MKITRLSISLALMIWTGSSLACAFGEIRWSDPLQREISLEDAQHRYTVLVRWSNFEEAAKFVQPDQRDAYLEKLPDFREFRFTEYESQPVRVDVERASATVEVTYYAYTPSSPIEQRVSETQEWSREKAVGNRWFVQSTFHGLSDPSTAVEAPRPGEGPVPASP